MLCKTRGRAKSLCYAATAHRSDELTNVASPPPDPPNSDTTPVAIEEEMKRSYLDYAMSVIVSVSYTHLDVYKRQTT